MPVVRTSLPQGHINRSHEHSSFTFLALRPLIEFAFIGVHSRLKYLIMTDLIFRQECHQIVGCAMEVLNTVGHGFHEKIYENGLVVEFELQSIPTLQQPEFPIMYKSVELGKYIPDLICFQKVIVDAKTIERISDQEIGQMLNYLKVTGHQVGLLINFKHPKLEWKRVVLQRQ